MRNQMRVSDELIRQLKSYECLRLKAYRCPAGVPTIGWGHTQGVKMGQVITLQQAEALLKGDILPCERYVNTIRNDFTQGQFDALVDFIFNLGITRYRSSTLAKRVLTGDVAAVQCEFKKWVYANGVKQGGLVKRRNWEALKYGE